VTLDDDEGHIAPRGTFHESKKTNRYQGYLTIMRKLIQNERLSFTDAVKHQVWKDDMIEEYDSIMKRDVWDVFPRPQVVGPSIVAIMLQLLELPSLILSTR